MNSIRLYHGTTADFSIVDLEHCKDKKDFGKGFYTTTDINQAIALAKRMRMNQFVEAYGLKTTKENKMQLIKALKPDNLTDQYCFKTDKALTILNNTEIRRKEY